MEIREYKTYNEPEILRLYASVGRTAYTDHPDVLRKGFENSMLTLAAYGGDQLLGIIRAVGDGHTLCDLYLISENESTFYHGYLDTAGKGFTKLSKEWSILKYEGYHLDKVEKESHTLSGLWLKHALRNQMR